MKNVLLYGHGGSNNHGCEALVRTITELVRENIEDANVILYSNNPASDYKWGVDKIVNEVKKCQKHLYLQESLERLNQYLK